LPSKGSSMVYGLRAVTLVPARSSPQFALGSHPWPGRVMPSTHAPGKRRGSRLQGLLERIVPALHRAGVPFMVAGSFASVAHGLPRSTNDLDIIIDPTREALESLLAHLSPETYYTDADVARDALQRRGMFNVIDHATGWKIDFIFRRNRPFSREELERRRAMNLPGVDVFMASAATMGDALDRTYLERWLRELDPKANRRSRSTHQSLLRDRNLYPEGP